MWARSIGVGLIAVGLLAAIIAGKNLWTIQAAWAELDGRSFAGIEFLPGGVADTFRGFWWENLTTLVGGIFFSTLGLMICMRSRRR